MGVNTKISVGPYMIARGQKKEIIPVIVRTCSNKECVVYNSNRPHTEEKKFCGTCGFSIENKINEQEWTFSPYDIIMDEPYSDEFTDELCHAFESEGKEYFLPNEKIPFSKGKNSIEEYDQAEIDLTSYSPEKGIEWFKERYKNIIEVFHKEFGPDSVEIKWGIIQWFN